MLVRPPRRLTLCGRDGLDIDAFAGEDFEGDVARDDLEGLPHLARDGVADLGRVRDVVEVAAAGIGELGEQVLIEVGADAERGRRDAAGLEFGGVAGELGRVLDADVGEAVRQQQAAVHALLHQVAGDLLAAAQPATAQVRAAAGVDLDEAFHGGPAGFAGRGAWRR